MLFQYAPISRWVLPYLQNYLDIRKDRYKPSNNEKALFLTEYRKQAKRITSNAIESFVSKYSEAKAYTTQTSSYISFWVVRRNQR